MEKRVTTPMEKLIWEIPGVEYVYSTTRPGLSMAVVRYKVGENQEDSIVKLYNKLYSHFDLIPPGASKPSIKPRSIDDVPILALTLWSARYDSYTLRRVAAQIEGEIKNIDDVSLTQIIGGERRQIRVLLDPAKMAALERGSGDHRSCRRTRQPAAASGRVRCRQSGIRCQTGEFLRTSDDVGAVVIGVSGGPSSLSARRRFDSRRSRRARKLRSVWFRQRGAATILKFQGESPAVTIAVSKRKGKNAVVVADRVLEKIETLKGTVIPADIQVTVTRNYGDTAQEKSNELLKHLLLATLSVTALIALALGWRSSIVVLAAVPVTLALTLFIYFIFGYTLNRVTLFALIFSIGILVDDAIVVVENITRHFHLPENKGRPLADVAVEAVDEVGNPTTLATWAVIAAILPMAFVGGLMGPYMRPIPVGASVAMLFSLFIAFVVSPWAGLRMLAGAKASHAETEEGSEGWTTRLYRRVMTPLLLNPTRRWTFLAGVVLLLAAALMLPLLKIVRVKMLPFDNKSEMQVIIDMPDGTTLEQTTRVAREVARRIAEEPEVLNYQIYAGTSGPYNFNGLVRHYFLRQGANRADIQVNLVGKNDRSAQSHDIAKRVRLAIDPIGEKYGARLKVAEIPPGPPVIQTLVAEVYGPDYAQQTEVARQIRDKFKATPGVVDVDWLVEDPQTEYRFVVDKEKAALNGIDTEQVAETLRLALSGAVVGLAHQPQEKEDVDILLRLPRDQRASVADLGAIRLVSPTGAMVPLSELTRVEQGTIESSIYHKNLKPRGLRHRRRGGTRREPGLRHPEAVERTGFAARAGGLCHRALRYPHAVYDGPHLDEVGRRVANHLRSLSRSRLRIRGGAGADLRDCGGVVPVVSCPAGDHGADSIDPGRHSAGACAAGRVHYRHFLHRLHCGRGNHRAEFDHSCRFHRAAAQTGRASRRSSGGRGRRALPAHVVDRGGRRGGRFCHSV